MNNSTRKRLAIYFFIPAALGGGMVAMYFSGNRTLQEIVAPHSFNNMHPDSGREFGLLENLQHVFILTMAVVALIAVRRKDLRAEKMLFAFLAAFALFVFLEEVDYGLHYYDYAMGVEWFEAADIRNIHNQGDITDWMKRTVDATIIVGFLFVAWLAHRSKNVWVRHLAPSRWFVLTLIVLLGTSMIAHSLGTRERAAAGPLGPIGAISRGNLSEFRELIVYYLFMVYVITWAFYRDIHAAGAAIASETIDDNAQHP